MNLLFICDEYPPGLNGGIGSIVQNLAREMVRQGHQVCVVGLYTYEYGCDNYEEDMGVKVWRLRYGFDMPNIKKLYGLQRRMPNALKRLLFAKKDFARYILFVKKLIAEHKIDIIEQPDWLSYAYYIGLENPAFPDLGIPVVLKFHGSHSYSSFELKVPNDKHFAKIDLLNIQRADALAAVSEHNASINYQLFGKAKPIKILYNSLAMPQTLSNEKRAENMVFSSGTIKETKGTFSLMQAWNLVMEKIPEAQIFLFGKGEIEKAMEFVKPQYRHSVHFKGHVPRAALFTALETASVAVFPSYTEAFGLAAVEAMSLACPTIFTEKSCGREIIKNNVTGILVNPYNIKSIAEQIIYLLQNPVIAKQLGDAGREVVMKRFEIGESVKEHIAYYQAVISAYEY